MQDGDGTLSIPLRGAPGSGQLVDSNHSKANDRWWEALLAAATTCYLGPFQEAKIKSKPSVLDSPSLQSDEALS